MLEKIIVHPDINTGKPTIRGTRITVEHILSLLAKGFTQEQILDEYPHINISDIQSALLFSVAYLHDESLEVYA